MSQKKSSRSSGGVRPAASGPAPGASTRHVVRWSLIGASAVGIGLALIVYASAQNSHPERGAERGKPAVVRGDPPAATPAAATAPSSRPAESSADAEQAEMIEKAKRFRSQVNRVAWVGSRPADAKPRDPRPAPNVNVVIFLIDTLRADRVGAYGYKSRPNSPFIDKLASEGVRFENAYAAAPWTLPSVASLFTSTCICRHNAVSRRTKLGPKLETLSEKLDRCGYDTYSIFANSFLGPKFGLIRGFDFFASSPRNDGMKIGAALGPGPEQPFFLYVHNLEPHNPYHYAPPQTVGYRDVDKPTRARMKKHYEAWKKAVERDFHDKRPPGTTDLTTELDGHIAALNEMREDYSELYDASVNLADRTMATVIKKLRDEKLWRNTMFIITSDHGEELGEHGGWLHDQSVYEEMLRVPLIIRFPGGEFAGKVVNDPVTLVDLMPTVMDYIGRSELMDEDAQGGSLMPLVRGETKRPADEPIMVGMRVNVTNYYKRWRETRGDVNLAMRMGDWKGIWNVQPDTFELYNLASDPGETTDRSAEQAEIVARLRTFAKSWLDECRAEARESVEMEELDEETKQALNAIGYVE